MDVNYSATERATLLAIAVIGAAGLNGVFLYAIFARPALLGETLKNPVALAFVLEALVLMGLLAYLLSRWSVSRLSAGWFVALSLLGGLAFAVPVVILWRRRAHV